MCGFTGLIGREGGESLVQRMLDCIRHRGPDGQGIWATRRGEHEIVFGHRRLAIIDVEGGLQPMHSVEGDVNIAFNGEVYNFMDLRPALEREGRRFSTRSDTEVVLQAMAAWGPRALERFDGMFAFSMYDARTGEVTLARDRYGIKPLYYASFEDGGLIFGSELSTLLAHPRVKRELDREGLASYLFADYAHPPTSLVRGVKKLPPGHYVTWKDGKLSVPTRFADLVLGEEKPQRAEASRELWRLLGEAVERQLVSDVPVGVFLSGGIDSSTITILASQRVKGRLKTFSIGFDEATFDESAYARRVAEQYGTEHVEERITGQTLLDVVDEVLGHLDEPLGDHSFLPTYVLSRLAARHVKVVLGGDAGDELFGGYPTYKAHAVAKLFAYAPRLLRAKVAPELVWKIPASDGYQSLDFQLKRFFGRWDDDPLRRHMRWMSALDLPLLRDVLGPNAPLPPTLAMHVPASGDLMNRLLALDFTTYMPGSVLTKVDRASMAHGLEVRPPMLDNAVVKYAFSLHSSVKFEPRRSKAILKDAVAPYLPPDLVSRRKQGFSIPLAAWLRGPLAHKLDAIVTGSPLWDLGLSRDAYRTLWTEHRERRGDHAKALWGLLVLDVWARRERF